MANGALRAVFILIVGLLALNTVYANPTSYLIEKVAKSVNYDGTTISESNIGSVEVELANNRDVLQNIVITLSSTNGTNLQNTTSFAAVAASPLAGDRTKLYVFTNASNATTSYWFNSSKNISLQMNISNFLGGSDLGPGENTVTFFIMLNATDPMNDVSLTFQARRNTYFQADSMHIFEANATNGAVQISDSDLDGYNDKAAWLGNLHRSANITIVANISGGHNYEADLLSVDTDSSQTSTNYTQGTTFSGTTISNRYSRANIRQGVQITPKMNWTVRGFMKNIAYGTVYIVDGWSLYEIGSDTPAAEGATSTNLVPGDTAYTSEYYTDVPSGGAFDESISKNIYYSAFFDWKVMWGSSIYRGIVEEAMAMPTLYQMDIAIDKRINLIQNNDDGVLLGVTDEIRHIGHANLKLGEAIFNTTYSSEWDLSDLAAFKRDGSNITELNISSVNINSGNYEITVKNLSLDLNSVVYLQYTLAKGNQESTATYFFTEEATAKTLSGTPVKKTLLREILVPGTGKPPSSGGGGGGTGMPLKPILEIMRLDAQDLFITESLLFNNVTYKVVDTGSKGLRSPVFFIYSPENSELDTRKIKIVLERNNIFYLLNASLREGGIKRIENQSYREYIAEIVSPPTETFTLQHDDKVTITYFAELPLGTSTLITRAYGYNYYEDSYFFEDVQTTVRREHWTLKNLIVKESSWEKFGVQVGVPVKWLKSIEVKNPNERSVKQGYSTKVLPEILSSHIKLSEGQSTHEIAHLYEKGRIDFLVEIGKNETQTYFVEAVTAPVLEVKRDSEMISITNGSIKFNTLITLENFAKLDYENVTFISYADDVIACNYNYTFRNGEITVQIPLIKAGENVTVNLTTWERPPKIIINLDRKSYQCREDISGNMIVVPQDTHGYLEIELVGPGESKGLIYADIMALENIPTRTELKIPLFKCETGNYTLYAFYRSGFKTILASEEKIEINCSENMELPWLIFLMLLVIALVIACKKIYRRKTLDEEIKKISRK
ncbi:MAG: hypothetical protein JW727_02865 [Candidatus Aenigmarchaeota archaeon]|nr:hypothetical protein [Candidatus Aenigmarchaeota archaeon]